MWFNWSKIDWFECCLIDLKLLIWMIFKGSKIDSFKCGLIDLKLIDLNDVQP